MRPTAAMVTSAAPAAAFACGERNAAKPLQHSSDPGEGPHGFTSQAFSIFRGKFIPGPLTKRAQGSGIFLFKSDEV